MQHDGLLKMGMFVRVDGLKSSAELNGLLGTIVGYNNLSRRWEVDLEPYGMKALNEVNLKPHNADEDQQSGAETASECQAQPAADSSKQCGATPAADASIAKSVSHLREGATVTLFGLSSAPELNGKLGRVLRFDAARGRWFVEVGGLAASAKHERGVEIRMTAVKALKAENLKVLSAGDSHVLGSTCENTGPKPDPKVSRKRGRDNDKPSIGLYTVASDVAVVTSTVSGESEKVGRLFKGANITVVEVVQPPGDSRIRARIQEPAGWISLENRSNGFQWAVKADSIDLDEL